MTSSAATAQPLMPTSKPMRAIGPRRLEANRLNSQHSTGPRTAAGKAAASRNALRHGVLALTPIVSGLEREDDWQAHRDGVAASLRPEGYLEATLADRVALQLWRLARVVRFERELLASHHADAPTVVRQQREARLEGSGRLDPVSVADAETDLILWQEKRLLLETIPDFDDQAELPGAVIFAVASFLFGLVSQSTYDVKLDIGDGMTLTLDDLGLDKSPWPATVLRSILDHLAGDGGREEFLRLAIDEATRHETAAKEAKRDLAAEIAAVRCDSLIPDDREIDRLMRYEVGIERSMFRMLHELQRLQAARHGGAVAPFALNVELAAI